MKSSLENVKDDPNTGQYTQKIWPQMNLNSIVNVKREQFRLLLAPHLFWEDPQAPGCLISSALPATTQASE